MMDVKQLKRSITKFPYDVSFLICNTQGSFPVRKRTGTLRIWRAREREPIWGSGGSAPSGSRGRAPGQGVRRAKPPEAEGILLPKRANLSLI